MRDDGMKMRFSAWDIENTRGKKYDIIKEANGEEKEERDEEPEDEVRIVEQ